MSIFAEKLMIFKKGPEIKDQVSPSLDQRSLDVVVEYSREKTQEGGAFIAEKMMGDEVVYKKSIEMLMGIGIDKTKAEVILSDFTNPFVAKFMDLSEMMIARKLKLVGAAHSFTHFKDEKGVNIVTNDEIYNVILFVANWQKKIYPRLKKSLGALYNDELVEMAVSAGLLGTMGLVEAYNGGKKPGEDLIKLALEEMTELRKGVSPNVLHKRQLMKKIKEEDKLFDYKVAEAADEAAYEARKNKRAQLEDAQARLYGDDRVKMMDMIDKIRGIKDDEQLDSVRGELEGYMEKVAANNPNIRALHGDVLNILSDAEEILASGGSMEEAFDALKSNDKLVRLIKEGAGGGIEGEVSSSQYSFLLEMYAGAIGVRYGVDLD